MNDEVFVPNQIDVLIALYKPNLRGVTPFAGGSGLSKPTAFAMQFGSEAN